MGQRFPSVSPTAVWCPAVAPGSATTGPTSTAFATAPSIPTWEKPRPPTSARSSSKANRGGSPPSRPRPPRSPTRSMNTQATTGRARPTCGCSARPRSRASFSCTVMRTPGSCQPSPTTRSTTRRWASAAGVLPAASSTASAHSTTRPTAISMMALATCSSSMATPSSFTSRSPKMSSPPRRYKF